MKKLIFSVLVIIFISIPVSAQGLEEQYTEKMDDILSEYSINFDNLKEYPFETLWETAKEALKKPFGLSFDIFYKITAVMLLTTFINFFTFESIKVSDTINMIASLVMFNTIFYTFMEMTGNVSEMLFDVKNFMTAFLPVFGGISFAAGQYTASVFYTGFFLAAVIFVANICIGYILPSVNLYLAVGITTRISSVINLKPLCELYSKAVKTVMTAAVSLLCFVLSLQTAISQGKDGLVLKAGKLLVTSAVPIIGSALENAVGSVYASMGVLKGFCGLAGISVIISIFIPHIVTLAAYWVCCQLTIAVGGILENVWAQELLGYFKEVTEIMLSMCVLFLVLLVFSVTVMIKAVGF